MNRRKFLKTVSFLAALPFLPEMLTKRLDAVVTKVVFSAPRTLTEAEWAMLLEPVEYPTFAPSDESVANILNSGFKGHYIKEEMKCTIKPKTKQPVGKM